MLDFDYRFDIVATPYMFVNSKMFTKLSYRYTQLEPNNFPWPPIRPPHLSPKVDELTHQKP